MDSTVPVIQLQPGIGILGLPFGATRHAVRKFFGAPKSAERSAIGSEADHWPVSLLTLAVTTAFKR